MSKYVDRFFYALPALFIGAGILVILIVRHQLAVSGGLLLIAMGCIELLRRYRSQRDVKVNESRMNAQSMSDSEGPPTPDLVAIAWRSSYACGHPRIDAQHQELFEIGNRLIDAALNCKSHAHVEFLLDELTQRIRDHFVDEEAAMARTRFPLSAQHCAQHKSLLEKASVFREGFSKGQLNGNAVVGFIVYDVIGKHIIQEDVKFALKSLVASSD